jgi:hypothetical protein
MNLVTVTLTVDVDKAHFRRNEKYSVTMATYTKNVAQKKSLVKAEPETNILFHLC